MADPDSYTYSYDATANMYTVANEFGQTFQMTEESFDEFIAGMDTTIQDLGTYRDRVLGGTVTTIREGWGNDYLSMAAIQDVDALNLKLGGFDDAVELSKVYREHFYPSRAEQLDRVLHGLDTGRVVSQDIKVSYVENDGESSADLGNVESGFESNNSIHDYETETVANENSRGDDLPGSDTETEEEDQPRQL